MGETWLELAELRIASEERVLVDGVGFRLEAGEVLALVGPSGAGKTLTSRALLGLIDFEPGVIGARLTISVDGVVVEPWKRARSNRRSDLDRAFAGVRGDLIGMVPQNAIASLNPLFRVRDQVGDPVTEHLARAGLRDVDRVAGLWPHQLSGGMARRVTIAQLLARRSRFVIVDEPTTGLDAVGVHELAAELKNLAESGIGVLLITHDLRVLPGLADRLVLIDDGAIVERLDTADLGSATSATGRRLLAATRRIAGRRLA